MTASATNDWTYWQNALQGKFGPVHDGHPQTGFYRKRKFKDGPWQAVAIFEHGGEMIALVDGQQANADDLWTFVCRNPVSREQYDAVMAGEPWSDAPAFEPPATDDRRNADPENELEALKDQIESAKDRKGEFAKIESDEQRDKAQALRARFNELSREADKKREAEKKPHLEAGKAVDAKWQPLVKDAKAEADALAKAMSAYETEKLRKQREEQARIDKERREAEEAARRAEEMGRPQAAPAPQPEPEPAPATAPTPIKGNYGRAATVKVEKVVTGITDQAALYAFLKGHPELINKMLELAQRATKAGHEVPGVEIQEEAKVA